MLSLEVGVITERTAEAHLKLEIFLFYEEKFIVRDCFFICLCVSSDVLLCSCL